MYPNTTYYVYTLSDPDDQIFYIGKGTGNRIEDHEREAIKGHKCGKCECIREIWDMGGQVKKNIVASFEDEDDALVFESDLINRTPYILNKNKRRYTP